MLPPNSRVVFTGKKSKKGVKKTTISRLDMTICALSLSSMLVRSTDPNLMKSVAMKDAKIPTDVTIRGK